jgi:hypothetical protein
VERLRRRAFLTCAAASVGEAAPAPCAWAVPKPYSWGVGPPTTNAQALLLPGAQRLLKIVQELEAVATIKVARSDTYGGRVVPFVPITKFEGDTIKGTHNQR